MWIRDGSEFVDEENLARRRLACPDCSAPWDPDVDWRCPTCSLSRDDLVNAARFLREAVAR